MPDAAEVRDWSGQTLVDPDGSKIGKIEQIYLDDHTDRPEWALVNTGLFGSKASFVPLTGAKAVDGKVQAAFAKDEVKDAPNMEPDGELSQAEEAKLYAHYGVEYSESRSDSGLPGGRRDGGEPRRSEGNDLSGEETDDAMTRSEEELRVGTEKVESGRVRLRKFVVTENVTRTVPVQREEIRLEREPITDANRGDAVSGPEISEEEHEVVLHEERPVVSTETVAKERVKLGKDTRTEEKSVSGEVRKEQIDVVDGEGEPADGIDGRHGTDDGVRR